MWISNFKNILVIPQSYNIQIILDMFREREREREREKKRNAMDENPRVELGTDGKTPGRMKTNS